MKRLVFLLLLAACNQAPPATAPAKPTQEIPGPDLATLTDSAAPAALLAYGCQYPGSEVVIKTRLGNIRVKLYDDTPIHKANFLLLARKGVFDETMFNRVVKDFAVQGGQTYNARTIRLKRYRLPPEFRAGHFHHKGALGMARYDDEKNPGRLSSNTDFYSWWAKSWPPISRRPWPAAASPLLSRKPTLPWVACPRSTASTPYLAK